MILMAALVWLPLRFNAIAGVAIIVLHNLSALLPVTQYVGDSRPNWLLKFLYFGSAVSLGKSGPTIVVLYVIVPWIGLMMAGYSFGAIVELPKDRRRSICLKLGTVVTVLFILLRTLDFYGDPRRWHVKPADNPTTQSSSLSPTKGITPSHPAPPLMPAVLRFLSTTKYPASLAFLLMTMGPMFLLLGVAERAAGRISAMVVTFGRVPMFYYLLHIPLIHGAVCMVSLIREGHVNPWLFANFPVAAPWPPPYQWNLGLLYAVYFICLTVLYFACKWYSSLRARNKSVWLSYL